MLFWVAEDPVPIETGLVALGGIPKVFLFRRIGPLVSFQFTTKVFLITHAALCAAPMTISLWRITRTACEVVLLVTNPSAVVWLTGGMMTGMIDGIFQLVNNLCEEFPLLVSVAVIILSFPSLV